MRAKAALTPRVEPAASSTSPSGRRLRLREGVRLVPFLRPFQAVEASLLALAAAVVDAAGDDLTGSRALLVALVAAAAIAVVGHLLAILASDRLSGPDGGASD